MYRLLVDPQEVPSGADLRAARQQRGIPLTAVAEAFSTRPITVSRIERRLDFDTAFAKNYALWLEANDRVTEANRAAA